MDTCTLCLAQGNDKRTLTISCLYAVTEVVPEMEQTSAGYRMRICKACRADLLTHLGQWRTDRIALRSLPKDHDGNIELDDPERNIPMRVNGTTVMMTEAEYRAHKEANP